jgi:hypothetical protein
VVVNLMTISGCDTDRAVVDAFLDLLCSDPDLLNAEFDAIVSAGWGTPPPDRPAVPEPARERPPWAMLPAAVPSWLPALGEPNPMPARQRGPPGPARVTPGAGARRLRSW